MADLLGSPVVGRIGVTLLHFVWQGFVVMLLAGIALLALRRAAAPVRYAALVALSALMLALPAITFALLPDTSSRTAFGAVSALPPAIALHTGGHAPVAAPTAAPHAAWWRLMAHPRLLVALWAVGVFVLSLRLLFGWLGLGLARRRARPLGEEWPARLPRLAARVGVTRPVALLQTAHLAAPTLVGWLRPAVLLPAAAVTGLTTDQLEMVLAHELAHLRRSDYLANLLQAIGETVLFYHPAVWWLSRRIRVEREFCCDDLAVRACGDPLGYAQVLTALGALPSPQLAVGGTGALSVRVRRLLRLPAPRPRRRPPWTAGAVTLALLAALAMSLQAPQVAHAAKATAARVSLKRLAEAVVAHAALPPAPAAPAPAPSLAKPEAATPAVLTQPATPVATASAPAAPAPAPVPAKPEAAPPAAPAPPEPVVTRTFTLKYITAGTVLYLLGGEPADKQRPAAPLTLPRAQAKGPFGGFMPEGLTAVSAESAHQLVGTGTRKALDQFAEWLKLIDQKPQQVTLDIVEVEASAAVPREGPVGFPRVVGSARLATMNLQPASCETTVGIEGRASKERLTVTPRINGDRSITLSIGIETQTETSPGTTKLLTAQATANVRDREPFAMSVPGQGTLIIITPTIMPDK